MKIHLILITLIAACASAGCTPMYSLPDPPPKSEWVSVKKVEESPEVILRRFLDAKRAAIQCFAALADKNWDGAMAWMTKDSAEFFKNSTKDGDIKTALDDKKLIIDGNEVEFDASNEVFIADLADIRDEFGGLKDKESEKRKELYAVSRSGKARKVVLVLEEDDRWRVRYTELNPNLLTE